jgi:hypothetical protein
VLIIDSTDRRNASARPIFGLAFNLAWLEGQLAEINNWSRSFSCSI